MGMVGLLPSPAARSMVVDKANILRWCPLNSSFATRGYPSTRDGKPNGRLDIGKPPDHDPPCGDPGCEWRDLDVAF